MSLETTKRIQLQAALSESAGAWSDEDHPDLMSVEDVEQYVRQLRKAGMPRSWDEMTGMTTKNLFRLKRASQN